MVSSIGKNTSPWIGGVKGVPGSDKRWRPVSEDCLVMIWETVRVLICGDPPRNTGFSWPWASLSILTSSCARLLDWALCLCLYTSTRIRGSESRAKMQAAIAKATGTEPPGGVGSQTVHSWDPFLRGDTWSRTWLWGFCTMLPCLCSTWMSRTIQQ